MGDNNNSDTTTSDIYFMGPGRLTNLKGLIINLLSSPHYSSKSKATARKITCGADVDPPGRYEFMVSLQRSTSAHVCGGALVAPGYVLSAAHCSNYAFKVQIGRHNMYDPNETYEEIEIEQEILHPDYTYGEFPNDIMLVKLKSDSTYQTVQFVENDDTLTADGADVTVMGWGTQSHNSNNEITPILQEVVVDVVGNEECISDWYGSLVTDDMMCASRDKSDHCFGDSGGPLIVRNSDSSSDILVGLVTWARGCESQDPGVYSRVSYFYSWIIETMANNSFKQT